MSKLVRTVQEFNAGREPERLAMKYRNMRASAFAFLRATCHLFPDQLPSHRGLARAPAVWSCGDLHLENFGSYKGDNRLTYFDINDFDEAALLPASWDLMRLMTSVRLAAAARGLEKRAIRESLDALSAAYFSALREGSARWLERETAQGPVRTLLKAAGERKRVDFLDSRCRRGKSRKRRILIDGKRALGATREQRERITRFMREFAETQADPGFFDVLDVARRIAGNGSLGIERYVVLVRGKGDPDRNYLLDLKQALPSALASATALRQPRWSGQATRMVELTRRCQAIPVAFLHAVKLHQSEYVLRDLQPSADRVSFSDHIEPSHLAKLMQALGQCAAWSHLRSSGRQGAAVADELIEFGSDEHWPKLLRKASAACAKSVTADWRTYCAAFDDGEFAIDATPSVV